MYKNPHQSNLVFNGQNEIVNPMQTNMSVVPQLSSRPNTLPFTGQQANNPTSDALNNCMKPYLSTPELLDRLSGYTTPEFTNGYLAQMNNDDRSVTDSLKMYEELLTVHSENSHRPATSYGQSTQNDDYRRLDDVPTYSFHQSFSQMPSRDRSISSSMNENDSSSSTSASSPLSTHRTKDELQYVPSIRTKAPPEQIDVVRKEKKRERNRQAAQKCRTRKLNRIAELQKRVNELQGKNKDLSSVAECLKFDITQLEKQLSDHHTQGCTLSNGSTL